MEKQITVVEFLLDNMHYLHSTKWNDIIQQAKEIEEEQMIDYGRFCVQCEKQGFIIPKNK